MDGGGGPPWRAARLLLRQRVVLLLRDVLVWSAAECADLLETSESSVHSALARARRTLAQQADSLPPQHDADVDRTVLREYVEAFEAYDVDRLVRLLAEDAVFSMPPFAFWMRGLGDIERWWRGPGTVCRGSRVLRTRANGQDALAVYHPVAPDRWAAFAVHLLETAEGRITAITHFLGTPVFSELGLPSEIGSTSSPGGDESGSPASSNR